MVLLNGGGSQSYWQLSSELSWCVDKHTISSFLKQETRGMI
jgi:hypothetical protein